MPLKWDNSLSVHVKLLDAQHKMFIKTLNELMTCLEKHGSKENLEKIVSQLHTYKLVHFKTEEEFFKTSKYPDAKEHIAEHKKFSKKIEEFNTKLKKDHISTGYELVDFVEDWLLNHIENMDHKYINWFNEHGIK